MIRKFSFGSKSLSIETIYRFRGLSINTKKWCYGFLVIDSNNNHFIHVAEDKKTTGQIIQVIPETVGMFSGMYDTKGIPIYEGDLIHPYDEDDDECCYMVFLGGNGMFCCDCKAHSLDEYAKFNWAAKEWIKDDKLRCESDGFCKIIGNIFEPNDAIIGLQGDCMPTVESIEKMKKTKK